MQRLARVLIAIVVLMGGVWEDSALGASAPKKAASKAPASKTPAKTPVKTVAKTSAKTKTTAKVTKAKRKTVSRSRRRGRRVRTRFVPRQASPTQDRIVEIQRALMEKGYLTGTATGEWKADSIDALKNFQADQSLKPTGRINALSLIALGLGPKHTLGVVPVVAPPAAPVTEEQADELEDELEAPVAPDVVPQDQ